MRAYELIFEGEIQEGQDPATVRQNLASLFGVPVSEVESLFERAPVVLKDGLDIETARQDQAAFQNTGALCRIELQPEPARAPEPEEDPTHRKTGTSEDDAAADAPMAKRRYGLQHPYVLAFFHKPFYRDVARHWRGLAFGHLLILLALTGVAFMLHFQALAATFVNDQAPAILAQIPPITIEDGKVTVTVEQPYQIYGGDSRRIFAVIDTTGQITSLRQTEAMLLLTQSRLTARIGSGSSRVIDLRPIEKLDLTRDDIDQWLQTSLRWAPVVLYPLMLFFSYCLRTVQVLIYGGIGMAVAMLLRRPLPFGATVAVAVMAMTPVILVDTLLMLLKLDLPFWDTGSFVVALVFLLFGIRAATETA